MAAVGSDCGFVAVEVDGFLSFGDGGGWFEGDAEVDFFSVADAALYASGVVGEGFDLAIFIIKNVVVFGAFHEGAGESAADFEAFGCGD